MRLIPSLCALACASALPLAAPAQTAAETPAPETVPDTAGRTVLDVTASGTLIGLAADALGPDAALTVRLHGPVAFDVDTADFASLEIFADDPAVKLTVSDTAAYDRITAVSIPAAASGEPAAAAFTAAAASAGIATLAEGDTTTGDGETIPNHLSVNVKGKVDEISGAEMSGIGSWKYPNSEWVTAECAKDDVISFSNVPGASFEILSTTGAFPWSFAKNGAGAMANGYRDGPWEVTATGIPYQEYTLVVYFGSDLNYVNWQPVKVSINDQAKYYYYNAAKELQSGDTGISWGQSRSSTVALGDNVIAIPRLSGQTMTFEVEANNGNVRSGVYGFQIVKTKQIDVVDTTPGLISTYADFIDDACVTATLINEGCLIVDDGTFHNLKIIGPETGTATLQIAANVDFSKIDLSEARNVTIELVSGCTTIPGGEWAVGDVTISTPVTLTVDSAEVSPYWSVGGTLTIAEGGALTVNVVAGVTITKPIQVIGAGTIANSGTVSAGADGLKVTLVDNVYWLTGSGTLRATVSESANWSDLSWWNNSGANAGTPVFGGTSDVVLTVNEEAQSAVTLTIDRELTLGSLAVNNKSAYPVTIKLADTGTPSLTVANQTTVAAGVVRAEGNVGLGAAMIAEGATLEVTHPFTSVAGSGTLVLDATAGNIVVGDSLRPTIRDRDAAVVLKGSSTTGVTLAYPTDVSAEFSAHLIVESGVHSMTYGRSDSEKFSSTGTNENPTVWVKTGATLNFTAKDLSGWLGTASADAVIRVDDGGTLNFLQSGSTTFYYRQRLLLAPGANMAIADAFSGSSSFRLIGGTEEATAQIFVPDSAQAGTEAATISGGSLTLGNDATNGLAISVGNNSELKIDSELSNHSDSVSPELAKYGSGVLTLSSVGSAFRSPVTVNVGTMRLSGVDAFGSGAVTLQSGATLEIVEGSNGVATTALSNAISGAGTLMVTSGSVLLKGNTVACDVSVKAGASLGGTGTITDTLTFADGSTLDASAGVLTVSGLMLPASGTVTVNVAAGAAAWSEVLRLSSGSASLAEAKKFAASGVEGMTVLAQGRAYVLAPLSGVMPENGTVTATVSADSGTTVQWSTLTWSDSSATYPSAGAGATNDLTLTIPYGVTLEMDQNVSVKSLTVRVTGEASAGPAQLTVAADMAFEPGSLALTEGALTVASATAVSGVSIAEGATLTVGHAGALGTSGIITGAGTLAVTGNGTQPTNKTGLTEDTWTGNVRFTGDYDALAIASYGHSESTVTFAGATGHLAESGVCAANVMLEGNGWESDNGWGGDTLTFSGTLSGSGSLTIGTTPSNGHLYKFTGDVSAFAGSITVNGNSRVSFGDVSSVTNGRIHVGSGKTAQIASGKTWSATTVAAGGELGGTGSVSGSLTLQANSTLDASAGALTVSGLTLPESGSVTVEVADDAEPGTMLLKKSSPTADEAKKFVVTDNAYVTTQTTGDTVGFVLGKVNTENLPAGSTALAGILDAAQDAAVSAGATSVTVAYGTSGGVQLTAETAEAGAELFTGITTTTTEASTTTVTVAYDFGITGITVSGNDIEVTAKVQGSGGASAGYASGTTVTLYKDGQNTGETGTIGNDGTVTFTLSDGLSDISDNTAAKFTVKAEKATP